jgi:ABC-type multidrug transport system ATPase subunit
MQRGGLGGPGKNYINTFVQMYRDETGLGDEVVVHNFTSRDELNIWMYNNSRDRTGPAYIAIGLGFHRVNDSNEFIVYWNSRGGIVRVPMIAKTLVQRLQWKTLFGVDKDFWVAWVLLLERVMNVVFGYLAPMLISDGLISIVPLYLSQPIIDLTGEVRQYMVSCTMSIPCYWLSQFIIDFVLWILATTVIWAVFLAAQIQSFIDNALSVWYSFVMTGPSFILFIYCICFCFGSAESASRQAFLVMIIILLIPLIIDIVRNDVAPAWLDWIYALCPVLHVERMLTHMLTNIGIFKKDLGFYFTENKNSQAYLVMEWVDILLYCIVLWLIESVRWWVLAAGARRTFGDYDEFFRLEKAKHPVTQEAKDMEEEVRNCHEYAVRVENCSRLFFNTAGDPIPAVNCVSLGVKEGSLFGFLGANGAGKTTLIKMITSMLPISGGSIEILGQDITVYNDPTLLSICPQFNTHLCNELTPYEHFVLYSYLFQLPPEEMERETNRLIKDLELQELKDKPIKELSGGDVRKLAIALSFLAPAKIVLLDEPTASLDPVARHHVHEMIVDFKGEKTFMLCTHLLSEAETLCDQISIMIKGCVYTVGSPGYLSGKFGTEFKVDVMLTDDSPETGRACDQFFRTELPSATLSITRPKARIYNVPAADMTLPELFTIMEKGKVGNAGFEYYTCSSSSLERVFMEIVRMSEMDDIQFQG